MDVWEGVGVVGDGFWLSLFEERCSKLANSLEDGCLTAGVVLEIARFSPIISKNRGKTQGRSEGNQTVKGKTKAGSEDNQTVEGKPEIGSEGNQKVKGKTMAGARILKFQERIMLGLNGHESQQCIHEFGLELDAIITERIFRNNERHSRNSNERHK